MASDKTWERHVFGYNRAIKNYGSKPITEIKPADIQQTVNDCMEAHGSDCASRTLTIWRQIFRAALMDGVNVPDYTSIVQMPKDKHPKPINQDVMISAEDFNTYIQYLQLSMKYTKDRKGKFRKKRIIYILQVLHHTGMRPAECLALSRSDIDLPARVIHVAKQVGSTASKRRQIVAPKTAASIRDIPISDALAPILKDMLEQIPDEHPFYDYDGQPFEIDYLSTFINRTAKQAGVKFNMYMCRHSMEHSLRKSGAAPRVQQDILGHTNYSMTIEYDRSDEDERKEAVNNLPA